MNKRYKIIVVDDITEITEAISAMLTQLGYEVIGVANDVMQALELFKETKPDLVMLDINLDKYDEGIMLGKQLNEKYNIPFIYLTAAKDKDTIDKARETSPGAYLIKPFSKEELYSTIELTMDNIKGVERKLSEQEEEMKFIMVSDKGRKVKVPINDILWVQSDNNYVEIITSCKKFLMRTSLENLIQQLDSEKFIKTHRSYVVQIEKIESIKGMNLVVHKNQIPISRKHKPLINQILKLDSK